MTGKTAARYAGTFLIFLSAYVMAVLLLYLFSVAMLLKGVYMDYEPFRYYQKHFYERNLRVVWQSLPECVKADRDLIYVPTIGKCHFKNLEFDTHLTFDGFGRVVPGRPNFPWATKGIALLGDSYTMGWGVDDPNTYAAVLQRDTIRPVFNLGVSSYGTRRELKRLLQNDLGVGIDTIVIQYTSNDLPENRNLITEEDYQREVDKFVSRVSQASKPSRRAWVNIVLAPLNAAVDYPKHLVTKTTRNFSGPHLQEHVSEFRKVLASYQDALADKRVILVVVDELDLQRPLHDLFSEWQTGSVELLNVHWEETDFFKLDGHLNDMGHQKLGRALANLLRQEPLHIRNQMELH